MVCKGDLVANWEFFRQQWEDFEVAISLDKQTSKNTISIATLHDGKRLPSNFPEPQYLGRGQE